MADAPLPDSHAATRPTVRLGAAVAVLALTLSLASSTEAIRAPLPDPRAAAMVELGRDALDNSDLNAAVDAFEAALALDPGYTEALAALADTTRAQGLPGKSITYYRNILEREPRHLAALAGEGQALIAQGAIDRAERNLALLESLCGANCAQSHALRAAISEGEHMRVAAGKRDGAQP